MTPLSVSALNGQIKSLLEGTFVRVWVQGEISNITHHTSGHIYFSIKDENSTIACVMFRGNASLLKFRLENGLKVVLEGGITLYTPRGTYQLVVSHANPLGTGSLALAFEQLKKKLENQGYFESQLKKKLPLYPRRVALITSKTGAAIEDMRRVAQGRWGLTHFTLFNTLVQGDGAARSIACAIQTADQLNFDVIIVGRGGGSQEDLWAFNEECVADAIFHSRTPIISAVGHEIDVVISDYVADIRAATPSNAMEILLPDKKEVFLTLMAFQERFQELIITRYHFYEQEIFSLKERFFQSRLKNQLELRHTLIHDMQKSLHYTMKMVIEKFLTQITFRHKEFLHISHTFMQHKERELLYLQEQLKHVSPSEKKYETLAQLVQNGKTVHAKNINVGENLELQTSEVILDVHVIGKRNMK